MFLSDFQLKLCYFQKLENIARYFQLLKISSFLSSCNKSARFIVFSLFLISSPALANNCIEMADLGVKFLANNEGDCTDNSNSYLSIYNNKNISSNNESKNNLKSLLSGHNDLGYTIQFSFDRNNDIALDSSQTLFAAYENINPNQNEEAIAEAGITTDGKFFYRVRNGNNDKSLKISLNSDLAMKEPHTVIIVYDQKREKIIVNIDGEESFVSDVPPLTTASNDIGQFRIGQGYIGTISLISTYSSRITLTDRSNLAKILSKSSNNIKIKPLQKQNGVLKAMAVEISAICNSNAGEISMEGGCVIDHCSNPSNVGSVAQSSWGRCANMLIVNKEMLAQAISNDSYSITVDGARYTFGNGGNNIFTGQVTDMNNLFFDKQNFNEDINYWDTSNVTDMSHMFRYAYKFNQDISDWNVSNVTNMAMMFYGATAFNKPLNDWDVSNVTDMSGMFSGATAFNQPLNDWDVSNVTDMSVMFSGATAFNQTLDSWNVSNVTNMIYMFVSATTFNQPLNSWDVSKVTNMYGMFWGANSFDQPLNNWDTNSVTNMSYMFSGATAFNQPLNSWNVSNVTDMHAMFLNATAFNQPLNSWNVSKVTNMHRMFWGATSFAKDLTDWNKSPSSTNNVKSCAYFSTNTNGMTEPVFNNNC
jgi:surface protein